MSTTDILNTIFSGFTAVGTVGAVIVALYVSFKRERPRLSIKMTCYTREPENKPVINFSIANQGKCPINVKSCFVTIMGILCLRVGHYDQNFLKTLIYSESVDIELDYNSCIDTLVAKIKEVYKGEKSKKLLRTWIKNNITFSVNISVSCTVDKFIEGAIFDDIAEKVTAALG